MEDRDPLRNLDERLNRRQNAARPVERSSLEPRLAVNEPPRAWSVRAARPAAADLRPRSMLKKLFIVALVFFLGMAIVAAWVLYRGNNLVTAGNIALQIVGPKTIKAGEPAALNLTLTNQNSTPLESVDLAIEYPPGTRSGTDPAVELTREHFNLGTLKPGEARRQAINPIIFGEAGSAPELSFVVEYRLSDSNAIFDKTTKYPLEITSAPVDLTLTLPDTIEAGQPFTVSLEVAAETATALKQPLVLIHYPAGFSFLEATPAPSGQSRTNDLWSLTNLTPGKKTKISISGQLAAPNNDEKAFRAEVGSNWDERTGNLGVVYDSALASLTVRQPALGLEATLNRSTDSPLVGQSKEPVEAEIKWANNLSDDLRDLEITVALQGAVLDKNSVKPENGFYDSARNVVTWNQTTDRDLKNVAPGESGTVNLTFNSSSLLSGLAAGWREPTIDLKITIRGTRVASGGEGQTEAVSSSLVRQVKYTSVVQLAAKALYHSGSFTNTGPLPPKVNTKTTYTIVWSLLNSSNDLKDARVQATLPANVSWVGTSLPAGEKVDFVPAAGGGGEVIWDLGAVRAGAGVSSAARELSFQVALKPAQNQVGNTARLMSAAELSATDSFTGETITGRLRDPLDTSLVGDTGFQLGDDHVVE